MMMMRSSFLEKAAVFVYAALQVAAGQVLQDVNTFGNNTLFEKWRTGYHFTAPAGWMNVCFVSTVL